VDTQLELWLGFTTDTNPGEDIVFTYGTISTGDPGSGLTVGAQDASGTVGATWFCNGVGTAPVSDTELRVTTEGLPVPEPAALPVLLGYGWLTLRRRPR
jgi:hypothetical protein